MSELRILGAFCGGKPEFFVTSLLTPEEAGSPFLNLRTAGRSFHGFYETPEAATERFRAEALRLNPTLPAEQLDEMVARELSAARATHALRR